MQEEDLIRYEYSLFPDYRKPEIKKLFGFERKSDDYFLTAFPKRYSLLDLRKRCFNKGIRYNNRLDFKQSIKITVSQRANYLCSFCGQVTQYPSKNNEDYVANISVVAHIYPAINTGPRGKEWIPENRSADFLSSHENAIFLCVDCSVLIDTNKGQEFTTNDLFSIKENHEARIRNRRVSTLSLLDIRKNYYNNLLQEKDSNIIANLELIIKNEFQIVSDLSNQTEPCIVIKERTVQGLLIPNKGLEIFPKVIHDFINLEIISLPDNKFRSFASLGKIITLKQIHLNNNKIESIPNEISNLQDLIVLNLKGNRISKLNAQLFSLVKLKKLDLRQNNIKVVPLEIDQLTSLQTLLLRDNQLINPPELNLSSITTLDLRNNHFRDDHITYMLEEQYPFVKTGIAIEDKYQILPQIPSNFQDKLTEVEFDAEYLHYQELPEIFSFNDLSQLLKIKKSTLFDLLKKKSAYYYRQVRVTKKGRRRKRIIEYTEFIALQKAHYLILKNILKKVDPSDCAFGYVKGRSHVLNAEKHLDSEIIIKFDFVDFFHSIKFSHVFKFFNDLGYSGRISACFSALLLYYNQDENEPYLPQGIKAGPYLSNLICKEMDEELFKIGKDQNFTYTRYSDDITFSTKQKIIPTGFFHSVFKTINKYGFHVNRRKLKIERRYNRQVVTGILVNHENPCLPRAYINNLRRKLYELEFKIQEIDELTEQYIILRGQCDYLYQVNPKKYEKFLKKLLTIKFKRNISTD